MATSKVVVGVNMDLRGLAAKFRKAAAALDDTQITGTPTAWVLVEYVNGFPDVIDRYGATDADREKAEGEAQRLNVDAEAAGREARWAAQVWVEVSD